MTLATPNHGTTLSSYCGNLCDDQAKQMAGHSPFLAWLNEGDETPGDTHYTTIRSNVGDEAWTQLCDGVVFGFNRYGGWTYNQAGDTTALEGAANLVSDCRAHGEIYNSEWTQRRTIDAIADVDGKSTPIAAKSECGDMVNYPREYEQAHARLCLVARGTSANNLKIHTELQVRGCGYYTARPFRNWYYAADDYPCHVGGGYQIDDDVFRGFTPAQGGRAVDVSSPEQPVSPGSHRAAAHPRIYTYWGPDYGVGGYVEPVRLTLP